jgi:integrase/recombinase XerD
MEKDGINCQWETPKPLIPNWDLNAKTIRQSVITNLLKQEKGCASCPDTCRPQKTRLLTERYRQTGLEELKAAVLKHHPLE